MAQKLRDTAWTERTGKHAWRVRYPTSDGHIPSVSMFITPQPDCPAPTSTPAFPGWSDSQDPPGWRPAFLLVTNALEGSWARFARVSLLLLVLAAAIGLLMLSLGSPAVGGLGISTAAAAGLARHARIKLNTPNRGNQGLFTRTLRQDEAV
ncbi:hypothetical protein FXN61_40015 [Lentzea sp. PSKA42]|uniref:Uncharacterized protein n=1 Tax=Lentzea indica TaxID=2604800 RepID=A0ABX1FU65_9PSEU|nr:hypothetical protein [Lentzea indica]NKE62586.1 hypothetical protein [Lentzea indica]